MGVSIEVWRGRIGTFGGGQRWRCIGSKRCKRDASWNPFIALSVILILLVIGNIECNPGPVPTCKFSSCTIVPQTIAASVRHQHLHAFGSNFMYYCPALSCPFFTKSFSALNKHVSEFHRQIRHQNFSETISRSYPCTLCGKTYSSLWDVVQHLCEHMDKYNETLQECPIVHDCFSEASFKKGSQFRSHLSQYHPDWRNEGCPIKFKTPVESAVPPLETNSEDMPLQQFMDIDPPIDIDPMPNGLNSTEETVSENLLLDVIGKFYLQLYAEYCIPNSTIQDICNGIILISELNSSRIRTCLKAKLDRLGVPSHEANDLCLSVSNADTLFTSHHKNAPGPSLVSDYLRKQYFKTHYNFQEPVEINLSNNPRSKEKAQFVPVTQTLTEVLQDPVVQKDVDASFCKQPSDDDDIVKDYTDGTLFKEECHESKEIHLFVYQDGYNPVLNALGSAKTKFKQLAMYFSIGNLSALNRSKVDTKHLVMLVRESVFKKVGAEKCFEIVINELKKLQTEGIVYKGFRVAVKVIFMLGDNLGQHMIGGFIESFSSTYFCRFCDITRRVFKSCPTKTKPQRTKQDYARCVMKARLTDKPVKGIKQMCEFNSLENFHAVSHLVCCLAHDLLEGVVSWDLSGIIRSMIKKKWFTYKFLNKRIEHFKCNGIDSRNKPSFVRSDGKKLGGHAVQNWTLLRLLPFIIGDKIEDLNDPAVKLYLLLKELVEFFCSQSFRKSEIPYVKDVLIPQYFELRSLVLTDKMYNVKPKHHYFCHLPELMLKYGPLIHLWTLGYEQKHKFFKHVCRLSRNFINVEYTCASRHQLNLAYKTTGPLLPEGVTEVGATLLSANSFKGELRRFILSNNLHLHHRECRAVTFNGVLYQREALLLISADGKDIRCGIIKIILCRENNVLFVVKCLKATFDYSLGIHKLPPDFSQSGTFEILSANDLSNAQPQPVYSLKGQQCFSLKGNIM